MGSKLTLRNKRRTIFLLSGTIFALTITASLFLISAYQSHVIAEDILGDYSDPITIYPEGTMTYNLTLEEEARDLVFEIDDLQWNIVDDVAREFTMDAEQSDFPESSFYFISNTSSVNWSNVSISEVFYSRVEFTVDDKMGDAFLEGVNEWGEEIDFIGRYPTNPREILITEEMASYLSVNINDTVYIAYNGTQAATTGFKITGIVSYEEYLPWLIPVYFTAQSFQQMLVNLTGDVLVNSSSAFTFNLHVQLNLDNVNLYNVNNFIDQVLQLEQSINIGIDDNNWYFTVFNQIDEITKLILQFQIMMMLIAFLAILFALMSPVIVLSNYVSSNVSMEMFEKRETEFTQFRSRGFSGKQMKKVISAEIFTLSSISCLISSGLGILLSYLLYPLSYTLTAPGAGNLLDYTPFPDIWTFLIFLAFMFVISLIFIAIIYAKPVRMAFQKEMIDSLKVKVKMAKKKKKLVGALVFMLILGLIPLVFQLLYLVIPQGSEFYYMFYGFETIISFLLILSPFFLATFLIKLLAEKFPKAFAGFCTLFMKRKNNPTKHVIVRNLTSKSKKVGKLMVMIAFTITFGMMVRTGKQSLEYFKQESKELTIGGEIQLNTDTNWMGAVTVSNTLHAQSNVTAYSLIAASEGDILNLADPGFDYYSYDFWMVNLTNHSSVITSLMKDKFLLDTSWKAVVEQFESSPGAALVPATLQGQFENGSISFQLDYEWMDNITRTFDIVGYYKAFPGMDPSTSSMGSLFGYTNPIILNLDFLNDFNGSISSYLQVTAFIETEYEDQESIDKTALDFGTGAYLTMTNLTESQGSLLGMGAILNNPLLFWLLEVDFWLLLLVSIGGIGIMTLIRITRERKEIGLFRVRGFDKKMLFKIQIVEKFFPILVAALIGVGFGFVASIFMSNTIGFNFSLFQPSINYSIDIVFTLLDFVLLIVLPLVVYFAVILLAIWYESNRKLGEIADEED